MGPSRAVATGASRAVAMKVVVTGASRAVATGASRAAAMGASRVVAMKAAWAAQAVALVAWGPAQVVMRAARVTMAASAARSRSRPRAPKTRLREHMQGRTCWPAVLLVPGQLLVQSHEMGCYSGPSCAKGWGKADLSTTS